MDPKLVSRLLLLAALTPLVACSSDDDDDVVVPPPTGDLFDGYDTDGDADVDADDGALSLPLLLDITALMPVNPDASVTSWDVTPALPAGLALDTTTGEITGAPTAIAAGSNFVVTATADDGMGTVDTDSFTLTFDVRNPVVGMSTTQPLVRSVEDATAGVVVDATGGAAPGAATFTVGAAAPTAVDTPNASATALVALEDVPGTTNEAPPGLFDATNDFSAFVAIFDNELSADAWEFAAQAPYDDDGLVPALPSFTFDTSTAVIEDGELGLDVSLAAPQVVPAFDSGKLPTELLDVTERAGVFPGPASAGEWVEVNGAFHGAIDDGAGSVKLFGFDTFPGPEGLSRAVDANPAGSDDPELLGAIGDVAYLNLTVDDTVTVETDLYAYDTVAGTLTQISDTNAAGDDAAADVTDYDGDVYFTATDGTNRGVYVYDAVADTVNLVSNTSGGGDDAPAELTVFGTDLLFTAADAAGDRFLYSYNATSGTQSRLSDSSAGDPTGLTVLDGTLYAAADTGQGAGGAAARKLFRWDDVAAQFVQIVDIQTDAALDDGPEDLFAWQGDLYFTALRPVSFARKLHRYQPAAVPLRAEILSNVAGDGVSDDIVDFETVGTELLFVANDPDGSQQLFSFDTANAEVRQVIDLDGAGTAASTPRGVTAFGADGDRAGFVLDVGGADRLFVYDSLTRIVVQADGHDTPVVRAADGDRLLFTADDGIAGTRLYAIE